MDPPAVQFPAVSQAGGPHAPQAAGVAAPASLPANSPAVKHIWQTEDYLLNGDSYVRRQWTLLRHGGQQLSVSRGRFVNLPFEQCICQLCAVHAVEDERHMICACPFYKEERDLLTQQLCRIQLDLARHPNWDHVQSSDAFFRIVMGALPMPSTRRQRMMARL